MKPGRRNWDVFGYGGVPGITHEVSTNSPEGYWGRRDEFSCYEPDGDKRTYNLPLLTQQYVRVQKEGLTVPMSLDEINEDYDDVQDINRPYYSIQNVEQEDDTH